MELVGKREVLWTETRTVNSQTLTDHFTSSREYVEHKVGVSTEEPALNCPDNLSLTQEVTGHTYSCLVSLLPPLHQVAKY